MPTSRRGSSSLRHPQAVKSSPSNAPAFDASTRCLLIRASAGTGKTYQLSSRYITLLRTSPPESILASTFTRKAAGEILERILRRLAEAALIPGKLQELGAAVGPPELTRVECLGLLSRLTKSLHRVRIGTLDSFFAKLVGCYALELGLPPGWGIADNSRLPEIQAGALESVLESGSFDALSEVVHWLAKGQTKRSVSELLSSAVSEMYHAYLSAPAAAWDRMPEPHFLSDESIESLLAELRAFRFGDQRFRKARDRDLELIGNGDWEKLTAGGLANGVLSGENRYYGKELDDRIVAIYRELIRQARAQCLAVWRSQTMAAKRLLDDYHAHYEQNKRDALAFEFGDLTRLLAGPDWPNDTNGVEFRLDAGIRHLLLDEFQDTSPGQWRVVRPFAEEICRDPYGSFFCVGDRKQAIYGWRGGEAAIFDAIERQLPNLRDRPLDMSRRSSLPVIDAVNLVMRNVTRHDNLDEFGPLLNEWSRTFPEHSTAKTELAGHVRLQVASAPVVEDDRKVYKDDKETVLLEEIVADIERFRREAPSATIGVLTRTNAKVGRIVALLNERGIEASEEGGNPITDSAAVAVVLSLLTLADQPANTAARFHVVHSPLAAAYGIDPNLDDAGAAELALRVRREVLRRGYGGFVHRLLAPLAPDCGPREFRRLGQLAAIGDDFDAQFSPLRPSEFVEHVRRQKRDAPGAAAVRVMNVHQSKGLEFDIVVLAELDKNLVDDPACYTLSEEPGGDPVLVCPSNNKGAVELIGGEPAAARAQTEARMMTESLCLLYVAMTRAVHALHLYVLPGGKEKKHPKSFAGLVRAALAADRPAEAGATLWEHGDPRWFETGRPVGAATDSAAVNIESVDAEIRFRQPRPDRDLPRIAPSRRQKAQAIPVASAFGSSREKSLEKGTLFHRWCEGIDWLPSDGTPPDLPCFVDAGLRPGPEYEALAAEFRSGLEHARIRAEFDMAIRREFLVGLAGPGIPVTLEVRNEFPFTLLTDDGLVNGTIDRLVLCLREGRVVAAEIVDFKTDAIAGDPPLLDERTEKYRPQLQAYRDAVSRLCGLSTDRIVCRLVFFSVGETVTC